MVAKGLKVGEDTLHGVALLLSKFHSKILKFKFNALNCTSPQEPYKSIIKVHINYFILLEKLSSKEKKSLIVLFIVQPLHSLGLIEELLRFHRQLVWKCNLVG